MFNEAVDKFWPVFEKNKIYFISKGYVKVVKDTRYSRIKNQYSITLNKVHIFENKQLASLTFETILGFSRCYFNRR